MKFQESRTIPQPLARHRSRIQILAEILLISSGAGVSQTEIIVRAKLNYRQLKHYLDWLVVTNLLETTTMPTRNAGYKITEKGYQLLATLDRIQQMLNNPEYLDLAPGQLR